MSDHPIEPGVFFEGGSGAMWTVEYGEQASDPTDDDGDRCDGTGEEPREGPRYRPNRPG